MLALLAVVLTRPQSIKPRPSTARPRPCVARPKLGAAGAKPPSKAKNFCLKAKAEA